MKGAALRGVAAGWIRVKNKDDLRQRSIIACGMPHHVAREEANMAAIGAIHHPICGNCRLLPPLNLNLHLLRVHHHILGHHLTTVAVPLARAALVTHLYPKDLHHNIDWMKRTRCLCNRGGRSNHFRGHGNICRWLPGNTPSMPLPPLPPVPSTYLPPLSPGNTLLMPLPPSPPGPLTYLQPARVRHQLSWLFLPLPQAKQQLPQEHQWLLGQMQCAQLHLQQGHQGLPSTSGRE
jgi:hypothetical protein